MSVDEHSPQAATHLTPDPGVPLSPGSRAWTETLRAGARSSSITSLRVSRDFRLLFAGQGVTLFGSMMTFVALPMQMFQLTHSSFAVGMLSVAEFVPMISMAFVGGALADYVDRPQDGSRDRSASGRRHAGTHLQLAARAAARVGPVCVCRALRRLERTAASIRLEAWSLVWCRPN